MWIWTTKDWQEIPYDKLKDSHLLSIKIHIENIANKRITVKSWWWFDCNGIWYDETKTLWQEALDKLDYDWILEEIARRGLS